MNANRRAERVQMEAVERAWREQAERLHIARDGEGARIYRAAADLLRRVLDRPIEPPDWAA